mgnify:CR=1 FL=1
MRRKLIFAVFAALLIVSAPGCIGPSFKPKLPGEVIGDELIDMEETREAEEEEELETEEEPTATPTEEPDVYPETISDPEDDLRVECEGEPVPGAGPAWADVVEVTRVSANEFVVTFRGEPRPITERIKENDGEDVPESFGVALIVETPEDEYVEFSIDWISYSPEGEREESHESGPDPAFKRLFNAVFEWDGPNKLQIILEPEERDKLAPQAQYRAYVGVDLAGADPPWACDRAPALN